MSNKTRLGKNPLFREALEKQGASDNSKQSLPIKPSKPTTSAGLPAGWTRATFIIETNTLKKVRDFAYWERQEIKEVVKDALDQFFKAREVKPRPTKKQPQDSK